MVSDIEGPSPSRKDIAIVVVNWKVREMLRDCVRSVLDESGLAQNSFDLIVVDNASDDGSVEMIADEFPKVTLVANHQNIGFGAANNQALTLTQASWIILLNPDTIIRNGALARMVQTLEEDSRAAVVGSRLLNRDGSLQRWTAGNIPTLANAAGHYLFLKWLVPSALRPSPLYLDRELSSATEVGWVSGACMAIRRSALDNGKLFDKRFFMYAEDMELCFRLAGNGWRIIYDPRATVVHFQGASLRQQSPEIMVSSLKGPRDFFQILHGNRAAAILDVLTVLGFGIRWLVNKTLAIALGSSVYQERALSSRTYLFLALRMMRRTSAPLSSLHASSGGE